MEEGENFKNFLMKQGNFHEPQWYLPVTHYSGVPPDYPSRGVFKEQNIY